MDILLGALAEAILSLLIEGWAERPKLAEWRERLLRGGSPEKLALQRALAAAYAAFSAQYPEFAHSFFDAHLLQKPEVANELSKALTPNCKPDGQVLIDCWQEQFPIAFRERLPDITESVSVFLRCYQEEITAQPALQTFVDSRAFQENYRHTELLAQIRDGQAALVEEIRRLVQQGNYSIEQWVVVAQSSPQLPAPPHFSLTQSTPHTFPPNPFADRGRINDPARFFGRQRILRDIQQYLRAGNCVSVVGESQIGKSSLLYYLFTTRNHWYAGRRRPARVIAGGCRGSIRRTPCRWDHRQSDHPRRA